MNKRIKLNLIGQILSFACSLGISFVLTPFIVSQLGEETYGFVGLANNVTSYITLFTVAISGMLSRYVTIEVSRKDFEEASYYFATAFITQFVLAFVLIIPMMLIATNVNKIVNISNNIVGDVKLLWILIFVSFLINLSVGGFGIANFAVNHLEITAIINIIANITRASILLISFVFFPSHVWYVGLATIVSNTFIVTAQYFNKKKYLPEVKLSFKYFKFEYIGKLLVVGIWNSINKLQQILYTGLDLLLTNLFIDGIEMGVLSIAKTVPTQISTLISTVAGSFDPSMTLLYAKEDKKEFLDQVLFAMKFCGFICSIPILGFITFGMKFYHLWMPALPYSSILKIQILAVLTLLPQIFSVYIFPLYTVNTITTRLRVPVLVSVVLGVVNVITVLLLLKYTKLGVYAVAGVSSVIWLIRIFTFVPMYAAYILDQKWYFFYKPLIRGVINTVITGTVLGLISMVTTANTWIALFLIAIPSGIVGYFICCFIIFNKEERKKAINYFIYKFKRKKA